MKSCTNIRSIGIFAPVLLACATAAAQSSNIDSTDKFCFTENTGWLNWRDGGIPQGSQGALIRGTFLSGFIWGENIGWINLGDGTPDNGFFYANQTGADFGVNLDPSTGALSGLAWGENIGWINFSLPSLPAGQQPRLDRSQSRLRGYAWGENIGWINLDTEEAGKFVAILPVCDPDVNQDGNADQGDVDYLINVVAGGPNPSGIDPDFNQDGNIDQGDIDALINVIAGGSCP
jgi:hypothetical protein